MEKCHQETCGHTHGYKCFYRTKQQEVFWFCSVECRREFEDERVAADCQREFARTGGWV